MPIPITNIPSHENAAATGAPATAPSSEGDFAAASQRAVTLYAEGGTLTDHDRERPAPDDQTQAVSVTAAQTEDAFAVATQKAVDMFKDLVVIDATYDNTNGYTGITDQDVEVVMAEASMIDASEVDSDAVSVVAGQLDSEHVHTHASSDATVPTTEQYADDGTDTTSM